MPAEDISSFNPFSPNRAIKRASVCICVLTALKGAVGFNDEIKVIYLYRGTKLVNYMCQDQPQNAGNLCEISHIRRLTSVVNDKVEEEDASI